MKAALLLGPGRIEIGDAAEPILSEEDVVIQPQFAGICGTDLSFYFGHRQVPYPFVLGHEVVGRVLSPGQAGMKLKPGQRVIVEPNYPCGACPWCRAGRGAICPQKRSMGVNVPGCFSERAVAPADFVWPLPDSISDRDATTIEPLAVSLHGLRVSGVQAGETVAVLGCGVVGQLLIHAALAEGIRVIAHDGVAEKLEMARRMGAIPSGSEDAGQVWQKENVTAVFECAGVSATLELALSAAPRGAQVILLGLASTPVSFVPMRLVREGINIRTSMIYDHPADFANAIDRVAKGTLHPARVVTHTFSLESVREAFETAGTGAAGKVHIKLF